MMKKNCSAYFVKHKAGKIMVSLFRLLLVLGVCYLLLFPLIYLIVTAIQDPQSVADQTVMWVPKALSGINFENAMQELDYVKSFAFSVFIALVATGLTIVSCSMVGYGFARFDFFEKKIAFVLVILLIIIPPQTTMMSTYMNFRFFDFFGLVKLISGKSINMLNSPFTLFLPAMFASGIRSGLFIFLFRQFFLGQPKELEEAARLDGCGAFGTFWRIMMPISSPVVITSGVLSFVWYWNDSFYSGLFFTENVKPLAVQLANLRELLMANANSVEAAAGEGRGLIAAAALLCIFPALIVYIILQRKFAESIGRTGIVG